jgi:hypothetical protein
MNTDQVEPVAEPCKACPWRTANHGKPHPDGWYTQRNRDRLWAGMRRGEMMSCHPTDPNNEVTDAAQARGYRPAPEHSETRECAGAQVLAQREVQIINDMAEAGTLGTRRFSGYRTARPRGLTVDGIAVMIERAMFRGALGTRRLLRVDLNAPVSVGRDVLPWTPRAGGEDTV